MVEGSVTNMNMILLSEKIKEDHKKKKKKEKKRKLTGHLWRVGNVVVHQLAPNSCHGRQMKVRIVYILVNGQRDVSSAGQERSIIGLARNADTFA